MRALIACVLVLASVAHADEVTGDRAAAERAFRAGEKAYAAQNFEVAAANFDEAFKALPLPEIAFSAAQAYRRQFRIEPKLEYAQKAVEHYRYYLDRVKTGGRVGTAADSLGEMIREVEKRAADKPVAVAPAVERTRLGVSPQLGEKRGRMLEIADLPAADAPNIHTMIDGKPVTPYQMVDVEPGKHVLRVEVEGYIAVEQVEQIIKGDTKVVELEMKPKPGKITVRTTRGARVRVDGRAVPLSFEIPAGKHLVTVQRSGRQTVEREVEVGRGKELAFDQPLRMTPRRRAVPYVFAGAAATGVLALGGLLLALRLDGDVDDRLGVIRAGDKPPGALDDYRESVARRDEVLTGVWITSGVTLGICAVAGALLWFDRPDDEGTRLTPIAGPGQAGVTFKTRF